MDVGRKKREKEGGRELGRTKRWSKEKSRKEGREKERAEQRTRKEISSLWR